MVFLSVCCLASLCVWKQKRKCEKRRKIVDTTFTLWFLPPLKVFFPSIHISALVSSFFPLLSLYPPLLLSSQECFIQTRFGRRRRRRPQPPSLSEKEEESAWESLPEMGYWEGRKERREALVDTPPYPRLLAVDRRENV